MTLTTKMMIGVFSMWIMLQIICNWFDGQTDMMTATDMQTIGGLSEYTATTSTEETGETSGIFQWTAEVKDSINKILFFRYSFWFENYTGYTEATCETAGGEWIDSTSMCQLPGPWSPFWYVVLRPIGWAILLAFVAIAIGKLF